MASDSPLERPERILETRQTEGGFLQQRPQGPEGGRELASLLSLGGLCLTQAVLTRFQDGCPRAPGSHPPSQKPPHGNRCFCFP